MQPAVTRLPLQVPPAAFLASTTLAPFLYPCLHGRPTRPKADRSLLRASSRRPASLSTTSSHHATPETATAGLPEDRIAHLNPSPSAYSVTPFTDRCVLTVHAGDGGHGCVSFLREKFISEGPPNGGDGGDGGGVYIQAVQGETSLHKLARRGVIKAGRGQNGRGSSRGGERGTDILITVPLGTIVRELDRLDPVAEEEERLRLARREAANDEAPEVSTTSRDKFIIYPGDIKRSDSKDDDPPQLKPRRQAVAAAEPPSPIYLDLSVPTKTPMLLVAGAVGGLGNPHFITPRMRRPKYASKGLSATRLSLALELKVLADVGLVGLPNAGKSTLLRALTNSRTRIGDWAFTTLQPSVGTVVLDDYSGRPDPALQSIDSATGVARTSFTIADIPGLIEDAHQDKGLGLGFLRHIERAAVLAFVIDLAAGDAVTALKALWKEVGEYETLRSRELNAQTEVHSSPNARREARKEMPLDVWPLPPPISAKPWFVVGTKADLPSTQQNFARLVEYVDALKLGKTVDGEPVMHPSGRRNAWRKNVAAVPVSGIRAEGVEKIPRLVVELLR